LHPSAQAVTGSNHFNTADFCTLVIEKQVNFQVPGATIGIVKDGELIFAKGFGYSSLGTKQPVTPSTLFPIGSTTKALTTNGSPISPIEHGQNRCCKYPF